MGSETAADQASAAQRSSSTDAVALAEALTPLIQDRGRSFIVYDEADNVAKAKLNIKQVQKAHDMLEAIHNIQPNLSFTPNTWKTVIKNSTKQTRTGQNSQ